MNSPTTNNNSFYIPRMHVRYDEKQVKLQLRLLNLGVVKRVDFNELDDANFKSAFVHMESFFDTDVARAICDYVFQQSQPYRVYPDVVNTKIYWMLLRNANPVPETNLNIHQVVENHRILEQIVFQQQAAILQLQEVIKLLIHGDHPLLEKVEQKA